MPMTNVITLLQGSCLCGQIGYQVADAFDYAFFCHCSQCRRATGAAAKPFAGIATEHLVIARGEHLILRYGDSTGHDAHCGACGSLLYSLVRDGAFVHVTLGTLIDSPTIRPGAHIFVGSKAPWDVICDDLPQWDSFPGQI